MEAYQKCSGRDFCSNVYKLVIKEKTNFFLVIQGKAHESSVEIEKGKLRLDTDLG